MPPCLCLTNKSVAFTHDVRLIFWPRQVQLYQPCRNPIITMYKHNGVYGIVYVAIACISKSCVFTYVIKWYYIRYTLIELVQGNMMKQAPLPEIGNPFFICCPKALCYGSCFLLYFVWNKYCFVCLIVESEEELT